MSEEIVPGKIVPQVLTITAITPDGTLFDDPVVIFDDPKVLFGSQVTPIADIRVGTKTNRPPARIEIRR